MSDWVTSAHLMQVGDVGVRFGCPSGLTRSNPITMKKWESSSGSFKTTQKLPLLKKKIILSKCENSLSLKTRERKNEYVFFLSL